MGQREERPRAGEADTGERKRLGWLTHHRGESYNSGRC